MTKDTPTLHLHSISRAPSLHRRQRYPFVRHALPTMSLESRLSCLQCHAWYFIIYVRLVNDTPRARCAYHFVVYLLAYARQTMLKHAGLSLQQHQQHQSSLSGGKPFSRCYNNYLYWYCKCVPHLSIGQRL